jgi:hypothetical protein
MATRRKSILAWAVVPDASGKVWPELLDVLGTNDVWKHTVLRIDQDGNNNAQLTTRVGVYGHFLVPPDYVGGATLKLRWTATVTTGNVVWDFEYRAITGDDAESLDQAGTQESVTVTDAAPGAAFRQLIASVTLTAGNFEAGDLVEFFLASDGTDAADTLAGARLLLDAEFEYSDA